MITYEYKCQNCNNNFTIKKKITDDSLIVCPKCKSENIKQIITSSKFALSGSGWFSDEYQKKE